MLFCELAPPRKGMLAAIGGSRYREGLLRAMEIMTGQRSIRFLCALAMTVLLTGCLAQVDRHGHYFNESEIQQIRPGMSKEQVKLTLGTPDTTTTAGGDVFYYISSTKKRLPVMKPRVVDRKVLAVYFDNSQSVVRLANYGMQDGRVVDLMKGETPSKGSDLTMIQQFFGNLGNRAKTLGETEEDPF